MNNSNQCSICHNTIDNTKAVTTTCNHKFCSDCFFKWMKEKPSCPNCRNRFYNPTAGEQHNLEEIMRSAQEWSEYIQELHTHADNLEIEIREKKIDLKRIHDTTESTKQILEELKTKCQQEKNEILRVREEFKQQQMRRAAYIREWRELQGQRRVRHQFGLRFNK